MKVFFGTIFLIFFFSFFSVASAATIGKPFINSSLGGYWNFEDAAQTGYAYDRSGNGQTGVLTNSPTATTSTTGLGQALSFDGTNKYVSIPSNLNIGTANFSVVGWAYVANTSNHGAFIKIGGVNGGVGIGLSPNDNTGYEQVGNTLTVLYENVRWIPTGRNFGTGWHQFGLVVNGSGYPSIYLDGQLVYSDTSASTPQAPGSNLTQIGGYTSGVASNRFFNGSLDEIRIYTRELSGYEMQRLYRLQKPRVSSGVSNAGLVGYWKMDEGAGLSVGDSSGNGNKGTLTGGWGKGKVGNALDLSSGNRFVSVPDSTTLRPNNITISLWFNLTQSAPLGFYASLISKAYTSAPWSLPYLSWLIRFNNDNTMEFDVGNGSTFSSHAVTLSSNISRNTWHHVVMTYDGTIVRPYLDNVALVTSNAVSGNIAYASYPVLIGADYGGSPQSEYFPGYIDDVRIYNRVLSPSEIDGLYKNTKATVVNKTNTSHIKDGLVGHWTFDGSKIYGTTAYDSSEKGNDGTLNSGPAVTLGKIGQALSFNGTNYINVNNSGTLQLTTGTVSAWIKTSNAGSGYRSIAAKQNAYGMFMKDNEFGIYDWGGGVWHGSGDTPNDNQWHHVACTFVSGVVNSTLCYRDGVLKMTTTMTVNNQTVNVMIAEAGASQFFIGNIDDVRVYNRPLSAEEIKALYNMGK